MVIIIKLEGAKLSWPDLAITILLLLQGHSQAVRYLRVVLTQLGEIIEQRLVDRVV